MTEKIEFIDEQGNVSAYFVLEQTRVNGINYLLVTDSPEDEDGEAFIMKDLASPEEKESLYEMVEDNAEFSSVAAIFAELLEDIDLV